MAEPQPDASDTRTVLRVSGDKGRAIRGHMSPETGAVWLDVRPVYAGRADFERDFAGFGDAPGSHPNIARAVRLVDAWPVGAAQARALVHTLHAAIDLTEHGDDGWDVVASSSHSYEDAFGTLWATVHSPVGLAEAIVHEMAHHKLRACGVGFTTAGRLVANHPAERYPSPLLDGRRRPMPALVQAHYALLHMVALETAILAGGDRRAHPVAGALRRRHLDLLRESDATLDRHLVVDEAGAAFMPAMRRWQRRIVDRSEVPA
jgi:HEXXH motif-containing protein